MRLAGANKGVERKLTIDEVSPKKTGQAEKQEPPVKSYRAERKENVLWTFLANEPAGVGQYGVKSNVSNNINYRECLFIFWVVPMFRDHSDGKACPVFFGELYLGLVTELGNLYNNAKGNVQ